MSLISIFVSSWRLCSAHHRRVDCSYHDLGFMEVSRFSAPLHRYLCVVFFRYSPLFRLPACTLQSSSLSSTRSTRSSNCCELVHRPERRFGSVTRVRWLSWSSPLGQLHVVLINNYIGNLISLRQSEITARRYELQNIYIFNISDHLTRIGSV